MNNSCNSTLPTPYIPIASLPVITAAELETDIVIQFAVDGIISHGDSFQLLLNDELVGNKLVLPNPAPEPCTVFSLTIPVATELKESGIYTVAYRMTPWMGGKPADSPPITIRVDRSTPLT